MFLKFSYNFVLIFDDFFEGFFIDGLGFVEFDDTDHESGDDVIEHFVIIFLLVASREPWVYWHFCAAFVINLSW